LELRQQLFYFANYVQSDLLVKREEDRCRFGTTNNCKSLLALQPLLLALSS